MIVIYLFIYTPTLALSVYVDSVTDRKKSLVAWREDLADDTHCWFDLACQLAAAELLVHNTSERCSVSVTERPVNRRRTFLRTRTVPRSPSTTTAARHGQSGARSQ